MQGNKNVNKRHLFEHFIAEGHSGLRVMFWFKLLPDRVKLWTKLCNAICSLRPETLKKINNCDIYKVLKSSEF